MALYFAEECSMSEYIRQLVELVSCVTAFSVPFVIGKESAQALLETVTFRLQDREVYVPAQLISPESKETIEASLSRKIETVVFKDRQMLTMTRYARPGARFITVGFTVDPHLL